MITETYTARLAGLEDLQAETDGLYVNELAGTPMPQLLKGLGATMSEYHRASKTRGNSEATLAKAFQYARAALDPLKEVLEREDGKRLAQAMRAIRKFCYDAEEARAHAKAFSQVIVAQATHTELLRKVRCREIDVIAEIKTLLERASKSNRRNSR